MRLVNSLIYFAVIGTVNKELYTDVALGVQLEGNKNGEPNSLRLHHITLPQHAGPVR
jgi:hypothetical protein